MEVFFCLEREGIEGGTKESAGDRQRDKMRARECKKAIQGDETVRKSKKKAIEQE